MNLCIRAMLFAIVSEAHVEKLNRLYIQGKVKFCSDINIDEIF